MRCISIYGSKVVWHGTWGQGPDSRRCIVCLLYSFKIPDSVNTRASCKRRGHQTREANIENLNTNRGPVEHSIVTQNTYSDQNIPPFNSVPSTRTRITINHASLRGPTRRHELPTMGRPPLGRAVSVERHVKTPPPTGQSPLVLPGRDPTMRRFLALPLPGEGRQQRDRVRGILPGQL